MALYFAPTVMFQPSWPLPEAPLAQKLQKAAKALERAGVTVPRPVMPLIPKARP